MILSTVFDNYLQDSPLTVMARALLEHSLQPGPIDELFELTATVQYTDKLLFSTVVDMMGQVVCGIYESPHAVYTNHPELFPVALKNVYDKLNGIEVGVTRELVKDNAARLTPVIEALGGSRPPLLPGFPVRILDGNCIAATEHRILELRDIAAAPLPGKTLNIYDPQLGLVIDVIPCEDGHAQERAMLGPVLDIVQEGELWIEDRNFCTVGWLSGVVIRCNAHVLVREHKGLPWTAMDELHYVGRVQTGEVWEQKVTLTPEEGTVTRTDGSPLILRRIVIKLDEPTRDGELTLALLTDLTVEQADSLILADLYLQRWQIETVFQVLTETLQCEHPRRGYPKAALFAYCVTLVAYNVLATIKAALRSVHGTDKVEKEVSLYHATGEIRRTYTGMMVAIRPHQWTLFRSMTAMELAAALRELASRVDLKRYKKAPTKTKKPKSPRKFDPNHPHVSTYKILAESSRR
jgi:hypothetical protein